MSLETDQNSLQEESLTTHPNQFSDDAWTLLLRSENIAKQWNHLYLDVEHLIQVIFNDNSYQNLISSLQGNHSLLLDELEEFLIEQPIKRGKEFFIGNSLEELLELSDHFRSQWGSRLIEVSHILIAIGRDKRIGSILFSKNGMPSEKLEAELKLSYSDPPDKSKSKNKFNSISNKSTNNSIKAPIKYSSSYQSEEPEIPNEGSLKLEVEPTALDTYGRDLTKAAAKGELDPVIGRDPEIGKLIKVLSRRGKNNPVLIGAPGVGKTAIAELLAQRIVNNEVPESIQGLRLIALDLGALIAGAKFRGQFEERFRSLLAEVRDPDAGVILFIDELHTLISNDRSIADAGSLLKPLLARGEIRCIGATTPENYQRSIEKDQALNRRFQQVLIKEPSIDLSIDILRGIKEKYELHHGVVITDNAIITATRLANRYISDRCLPDKAIDLIDEASAQLKLEITSKPQVIEELESDLKNIELSILSSTNSSEEEKEELEVLRRNNSKTLSDLLEQWQNELSLISELSNLLQQDENLRNEIIEAEKLGEIEEAARIEYDQLHSIQKRRKEIEAEINVAKASGNALLRDQVESEDVADVVARWTGIPVQRVLAEERQKLLNLEIDLSQKVIGQAEAVQAVSAAIRRARAGMKDSRRPVGSFLFLGPTGVGKTELAKTLASSLFDEQDALIRLDMSEFMERNAVARLIGAPPGYVGYEEGGQLTEAVRRRPYAVLLLDEIEKAHSDVFNLLLQVLDDGRLTDSQGRTVDFRHTIIVMTSNLASRQILDSAKVKREDNDNGADEYQNLSNQIDQALTKHFRPEFLNRIDETIIFHPLKAKDLQKIVRLQLAELEKLLIEQGLELRVDDETIKALAAEGYEPEYGARPLNRVLRRKLENPLATQLLEEKFHNAKAVRVQASNQGSHSLIFFAEN